MVKAESTAQDGPAAAESRSPGDGNTRVHVERVRVAETGSRAAEAYWTAGREVERNGQSRKIPRYQNWNQGESEEVRGKT
jgi:hypothetical protein